MARVDTGAHLHSVQSTRQTTGALGGRQVQQTQSDAARLGDIRGTKPSKGNIFQRIFSSEPTKLARTARGLARHTDNLARILDRGTGQPLAMQDLANATKTLRLHGERLGKLGQTTVNHSDLLQVALAGTLGSLKNEKLLDLHRTFMSSDMTQLRAILEREVAAHPENVDARNALDDLGTMEATVMMEVSTRLARSRPHEDEVVPSLQERLFNRTNVPGLDTLKAIYGHTGLDAQQQSGGLTDRGLETLVNAGGRSAALRDGIQAEGRAKLDRKGLDTLQLREIGDAMRSADLTMNMKLTDLLGIGHTISPAKQLTSMRNMFQWGSRPAQNAGAEKRDLAERGFFPALEKDALDPDDRPMYAALNVGRQDAGAADAYGTVHFVLRPEVKQRCTYTCDDTFNVTMLSVNSGNITQFSNQLDDVVATLSPGAQTAMAAKGGKMKKDLVEFFSGRAGSAPFTVMKLAESIQQALLKNVSLSQAGFVNEDFDKLANLAEKTLRDAEATRQQIVGFDDLESLLPFIGDERQDAILAAATTKTVSNVRIGNYIEAQVHGGVRFGEDVAALRLTEGDLEGAARALLMSQHADEEDYDAPFDGNEFDGALADVKQQLTEFAERHGIELQVYDEQAIAEKMVDAAEEVQDFAKVHNDVITASEKFVASTATTAKAFPTLATQAFNKLGFTGTLTESEKQAVVRELAVASSAARDGGAVTADLLAEHAPAAIESVVSRKMTETQRTNEQRLFAFLDPSATGDDSLRGVLSRAKDELGFTHDLNTANVQRMAQNIHRAFGKVNDGNATLDTQTLGHLVQKEVNAFLTMKQNLLGTLDKLTFARPQDKQTWTAFVLGSTTLRHTEMLTSLHGQTTSVQGCMAELLKPQGLGTEAMLGSLFKFVAGATHAQNTVMADLNLDLGRDDRYLYLDRALSVAVSTSGHSKGQLQTLYDRLTSDEVGQMRRFAMEQGTDELLAGNLSDTMLLMARNVGRELGIDPGTVDDLMGNKFAAAEQLAQPSTGVQQALSRVVK